ncbi:hypothetical protein [Ardenticatena maritima]|uniref:Uncharacterized protein n=1 Tax=Ardenticatena maritima TaxID=872965 RepID=A0A0P6YCU0_9CHLR|nr:hypothetical protein [Ardenticatena maritima]KPL89580.1 hypothetical protein SE16_03955 [Ardenticatena maritima]
MKRRILFAIFVLGCAFVLTRGALAGGGAGKTLYLPLIAAPQPLEYIISGDDAIAGSHYQEGRTKEEAINPPFHNYNIPWATDTGFAGIEMFYFPDPLYEFYRSFLEVSLPDLSWQPDSMAITCNSVWFAAMYPEQATLSIHKGTWAGSLRDVEGQVDAVKYHWDKFENTPLQQFQLGPDDSVTYQYTYEINNLKKDIVDSDGRMRLVFRFHNELDWDARVDQEIRWGCDISTITLRRSSP